MKKENFKFEDVQLNNLLYSNKLAELDNIGAEFTTAIELIKNSGFPTDEKFIREHLLSEMSLRLYLNSLAKAEIEKIGGLMADDNEKEKIIGKFKLIFDNLKGLTRIFFEVFEKKIIHVITDGKEGLIYDGQHSRKAARLFAEYRINGEELAKYREMCIQMYDLRKKIKKFEESHGMHNHFGLGELFQYSDKYSEHDVIKATKIDTFFTENLDNEQNWVKIFGIYFKEGQSDGTISD